MSRRMVAPGVWVVEQPEAAHLRARSAYSNVPAEVVGNMRPILTYGGSWVEFKSDYRLKAMRVKP